MLKYLVTPLCMYVRVYLAVHMFIQCDILVYSNEMSRQMVDVQVVKK